MANIRINALPNEAAPSVNDVVPIDNATTRKTTIKALVQAGRPAASQAEAEAGTDAEKAMTPLTTKQAIAAQGPSLFATKSQGDKADTAVQPGDLGSAAYASSSSFATASQGSKADSAVQAVNGKTGTSVTLGPGDVGAADDAVVVKLSGDQTIAGRKSFTDGMNVGGAALENDDDGTFGIGDAEGNLVFKIGTDGVTQLAALLLGGVLPLAADAAGNLELPGVNLGNGGALLRWNDDFDALLMLNDSEGNCALKVENNGLEFIGGGTVVDPITHTVYYGFIEPWSDPSADAVVSWVSTSADERVVEARLDGSNVWITSASHRSRPWPSMDGYYVHSAAFFGLSPDALYHLRWPRAVFTDRFMTSARSAVRVAFLSDFQNTTFGAETPLLDFGAVIQARMPHFLLFNGDYVNDDGRVDEPRAQRWYDFLQALFSHYRRDGALIPCLFMAGNHEGRNAADNGSAIDGGDGTLGLLKSLFSFGYDPENPARHVNSNSRLSIGRELLFLTLETNHTQPLPDQLPWFEANLPASADYRHTVIVGHCPAFCGMGTYDFGHGDNQARALRNLFWPAMEPYAGKIRFYVGGHEHILAVTDKLRMDYDPMQSLVANDTRWAVDPAVGVRQIGSGPWGNALLLDVDPARAGEVSTIDSSVKMLAAMGFDGTDVQTFGTGITNPGDETSNIWIGEFSADGWSVRAVGRDGRQFYEIEE